jgi:N-formylglutamate amidohydrolase
MTNRLPFILSVPHAGLTVPPEVEDECLLNKKDIIEDGDEGASEIYLPLKERVAAMVTTDIARAIVDMNRAEDDRRKDGVVKTHTCRDVPIYRAPLSGDMIEHLLERYHRPYHRSLDCLSKDIIAGIDCHTMAVVGPPVGPDSGKRRPSVCLSNGEETCQRKWLASLAGIIEDVLGVHVAINRPFKGGHIIRRHAVKLPWLQLELSRAPFYTYREKSLRILESLERWYERLT